MSTSCRFQELNNVPRPHRPRAPTFMCKEFRLIRWLLRLLSLWRPRSAGILESYLYPIIVNLLLLSAGLIRNSIQAISQPLLLSVQTVYLVHELGIWLGHIFGNIYFRSRDLETNVLLTSPLYSKTRKPLRAKLKYLNVAIIVSLSLFSIMLCAVFIVSTFKWNRGTNRFSSELPHVHGTVDHVLYFLVIAEIVYDLGIGLALPWTMGLLYLCFASRLKALEGAYLTWQKPAADAVYFFQQVYARPVRRSWKRVSLWFLAHNVIVVAIPLYGYELAQAVCGEPYHSKHLSQFICYLVFVLTVWFAPILIAEQIKRRERKFMERVNDFCPGLLEEITSHSRADVRDGDYRRSERQALACDNANEVREDIHTYTFASRGKGLRDFLRFLKKRRLGLVSRGYTLQLNLSLVSLLMGILSFLLKVHGDDEMRSINAAGTSNNTLF